MASVMSLSADFKRFERGMDEFSREQIPYATARALTSIARIVQQGERDNIASKFKAPKSFTINSVGSVAARKNNPTARVFVKPKQANYLAPSEFSTPQYLGAGKKIRTPVDIGINASGDIPQGKLKQLLAQSGVFIGAAGGAASGTTVRGIWKRGPVMDTGAGRGAPGIKRAQKQLGVNKAAKRKLQLLVAFTRPKTIATKLGYRELAEKLVRANLVIEFDRALRQAKATAR